MISLILFLLKLVAAFAAFGLPSFMVTFATDKLKNAISKFTGGTIWIKEVQASGADLATPDTWVPLGYFKKSNFKDDTVLEDDYDSSGAYLPTDGNRKLTFDITFMQRSGKEFVLTTQTAAGKFFALMFEASREQIAGKYQYIYMPICRFTKSIEWDAPSREIVAKVVMFENSTSLTAPTGATAGGLGQIDVSTQPGRVLLTAAVVVVPAHQAWVLYEQAS